MSEAERFQSHADKAKEAGDKEAAARYQSHADKAKKAEKAEAKAEAKR